MLRFVVIFTTVVTLHSQQWQRLLDVPTFGIAFNPKNPQTIYVGGLGRELYRSYDGGKSWDTIVIEFRSATTEFTNLLVHPIDTNVVLVGGIRFGTLQRSTDNGVTWEPVLSGTQNYVFSGEALIIDPNNPQILYAGEFQTSTIFRSTDRGRTWKAMGTIPPDSSLERPFVPRLCCLTMRPDSTGILYAGCQGSAIYRSEDSGKSWRLIQRFYSTQLRDTEIPQIRFSSLRPNIGYAVMTYFFPQLRPNGGLHRTTDGGWTWHPFAFVDTSLWAMGIRNRGDRDEIVVGGFTELFTSDTIIPGARIVRRSIDEGRNWHVHDDAIPWMSDLPGNVFAFRYISWGGQDILFCATDAGLFSLNLLSDEPLPPLERPRLMVLQPSRDVAIVVVDDPTVPWNFTVTASIYSILGQEVGRSVLRRYGQRAFYGELPTNHLPVGVYFVRAIAGDPIADIAIIIGH